MPAPTQGPSRIEIHALVHATEEGSKVKTAIQNIFSKEAREHLTFERTALRGHFHNPIIRLVATLTRRPLILQTIQRIGAKLSKADREQLDRNFSQHINEKGQLFLRFDKQESYQEHIRLIDRGDSLRAVIRFTGPHRDPKTLRKHYQQLNLF